jgi:electron transfer flavoprotein beta subunit
MTKPAPLLAVCWKWVDHRPDINAVTGAVDSGDARFGGVSEADAAALEMALQVAQAWNARVRVVTAGGSDAERALRDALAAGAHEVLRVDLDPRVSSAVAAGALAEVVADAAVVWCGDYSVDRGSGSVPAFVAARLGWASALGAIAVDVHETGDPGGLCDGLRVVRRLDGGRREVLTVSAPAVVSVEGSVATLRRAALASMLRAERADIPTVNGPTAPEISHHPLRPFRPRARALAAPQGATALDRVRQLTGSSGDVSSSRTEVVTLEPRAAAERILHELQSWGAGGDH